MNNGSISEVWFWFIHLPFLGWIIATCVLVVVVLAGMFVAALLLR